MWPLCKIWWLTLLNNYNGVFSSISCSLMIQIFTTHNNILCLSTTICLIILQKNKVRKYFKGHKKIREYIFLFSLDVWPILFELLEEKDILGIKSIFSLYPFSLLIKCILANVNFWDVIWNVIIGKTLFCICSEISRQFIISVLFEHCFHTYRILYWFIEYGSFSITDFSSCISFILFLLFIIKLMI